MELNIMQEELNNGVLDNPPDKLGKKIRLREISYINSKRHTQNIPFRNHATTVSTNEPVNTASSKVDYSLKNIENPILSFGSRKPINLKENMITNLDRHVISFYNQSKNDSNTAAVSTEVSETALPQSSIEEVSTTAVDKKFEQIANAREFIKNAKSKADSIKEEVKQLDDELSRLSIEDTESQKRLQDALLRQDEIKRQIEDALEKQHITLSETRKKFEMLINDAENQKQQRKDKIVQFQEKIANTDRQVANIENDIAQQQEILNALRQIENPNNIIEIPNSINITPPERKIV